MLSIIWKVLYLRQDKMRPVGLYGWAPEEHLHDLTRWEAVCFYARYSWNTPCNVHRSGPSLDVEPAVIGIS
jgi:hypothetical protein